MPRTYPTSRAARGLTDEEYEDRIWSRPEPYSRRVRRLLSSTRWQQFRRSVIEASDGRCGICGAEIDLTLSGQHRLGPTVDHITPLVFGGRCFDRSNARLAHRSCNCRHGQRHRATEMHAYRGAAEWMASQGI